METGGARWARRTPRSSHATRVAEFIPGSVSALVAVLAMSAVLAAGAASASSRAAPPVSPGERAEISTAFAHFLAKRLSSVEARRLVEAADPPLAASLRAAATGFLAGFTQGGARMSVRVRSIVPFGPNITRVAFAVVVTYHSGSYAQSFTGAAVRIIENVS